MVIIIIISSSSGSSSGGGGSCDSCSCSGGGGGGVMVTHSIQFQIPKEKEKKIGHFTREGPGVHGQELYRPQFQFESEVRALHSLDSFPFP